MAHAFRGALRRSLIATAAAVLLGTVGASCGVVVRGPAQTGLAEAITPLKGPGVPTAAVSAQPDSLPEPSSLAGSAG